MTYDDLNEQEKVLYLFFTTFGKGVNTISYPISILAVWTSGGDPRVSNYSEKQAVIDAYLNLNGMDKPLYLAIKDIKGWK